MRCDLIIPALNEATNISDLFDAIQSLPDGLVRHVVLADNDSTDGTPQAAQARGAIVVHEPKRGYGAACLKALEWIEQQEAPEVVAFLDADLSDDPAILPALLQPIARNEADIVIGSRVKLAEPGALNAAQRWGGRLACAMIAILAGKRYTDLGPFRAVRWTIFQRLAMADRTWGWTVELQMKAALMKIPTIEIDVPYRRRAAGRSKISGTLRGLVAAGTKIIITIITIRWQHYRKRGHFTSKKK
ncbi:MAG: glycosyltransferase family 2 protein [Phycisphaerales bacterium]